jgi:CBS domain containing-hemolysin-like protein
MVTAALPCFLAHTSAPDLAALLREVSFLQDPLAGGVGLPGMALALLLLALASVGAQASAAMLACSPTKLERLLPPEAAEATLLYLRKHDMELRVSARLLMIGAAAGSLLLARQAVDGHLGEAIFAAFCLLLLLVVAVFPAVLAQRNAEPMVKRTLPIIRPLSAVLRYPVLRPLLWVTRPLLRAFKVPEHPHDDPEGIADHIMAAVADSAGPGTLAEEERAWISNIVELKALHVSEAMTPRTDIYAFDAKMPLVQAVREAVAAGHSRFPVYNGSIDDVVGVFYAKDVLTRVAAEQDITTIEVGSMCREPLFTPESMGVSELLREFRSKKVQMAIVLDEYGGTAGLITIEDILEEIVGDISDEYDPEEEAAIKVLEDRRVIEVSGRTRVEEANDALQDEPIPEGGDYDTVGGFVFAHLGRIPEVGAAFESGGIEYRVLSTNGRRIGRLRLTRLMPQPSDT